MTALQQHRAGVVEHRVAHHRGADNLRLADLLDPLRDPQHRRRAGKQLRCQNPQLAIVQFGDRRQRDPRGGICKARQPEDQRLTEHQCGIDLGRVRERQPLPLLVEAAEQVRRPRLRVKRRLKPRRRFAIIRAMPTSFGCGAPRVRSRPRRCATRAGWPPDPRRRFPPLTPRTVDRPQQRRRP